MKKPLSFPALVLALLLAGCGGDHGDRGSSSSPFAGSYTGSYASTATDNDDAGTFSVTVGNDGTIVGSTTDSRYAHPGTVVSTSRIQEDGTVVLSATFPNDGLNLSTTFRGTLTKADATTLTGSLDEQKGDFTETFAFTLNRKTN